MRKEDLELSEKVLKILEKEKVNDRDLFKITEEKLEKWGMPGGPATRLVNFAKECKEKKLRAFSSYLSLSEVLKNMV